MALDFNYKSSNLDITENFFKELREDGLKLKDMSAEQKKNKQAVLIALRQNGLALQYVSPELLKDEEIIITALKQNIESIMYVPLEMQENVNVMSIYLNYSRPEDEKLDDYDVKDYIQHVKMGHIQRYEEYYNYCLNYLKNSRVNSLDDIKSVLKMLDKGINFYYLQMNPKFYLGGFSNDTLGGNLEKNIYKLVIEKLNQDYQGRKIGDILISECMEKDEKLDVSLLRYDASKYFSKFGFEDKMLRFTSDKFLGGYVPFNSYEVYMNSTLDENQVEKLGKPMSQLTTLRHEMAHLEQFLVRNQDTEKGKFYRKVFEYEDEFNKNMGTSYHDGKITEYAADMKSYDEMITSIKDDYKSSKTEELVTILETAKKERKEKYLKEDLDYFKKLPPIRTSEQFTDEYIEFAKQNVDKVVDIEKNVPQEKNEELSDLDKLIKAIKITEDKFAKSGEASPCDLGKYLESGDLNVFTETNGARNLVAGIDYKKIRKEVIMRMVDNTIKFLEKGIISPNDSMTDRIVVIGMGADAIKSDEIIEKRAQSGITITDIIDEELKSHEYDYDLTKTLLGNIEISNSGAIRDEEAAKRYANRLRKEKELAIKYDKTKKVDESIKKEDPIPVEKREEHSQMEITEEDIKKLEFENDGIRQDISQKEFLINKYNQLLAEQKSLTEQQAKINSEFAQLAQMVASAGYTLPGNNIALGNNMFENNSESKGKTM